VIGRGLLVEALFARRLFLPLKNQIKKQHSFCQDFAASLADAGSAGVLTQ
jgi:hypothetical protein